MLVHQVHSVPFYMEMEDSQLRIMHEINKRLPQLAPLARYGTHAALAKAELAELMELCLLLKDRIGHSGEALHGLAGMVTTTNAVAA
jgi:hypothetical protein